MRLRSLSYRNTNSGCRKGEDHIVSHQPGTVPYQDGVGQISKNKKQDEGQTSEEKALP